MRLQLKRLRTLVLQRTFDAEPCWRSTFFQTSDSSNGESEDYEPVTSTPLPSDKRLLDSEVLASIKARACDRVSKVPSTAKTPPISQSVAKCLPNWSSAAVSSSKKVIGSNTQASNTKWQTTPRGKLPFMAGKGGLNAAQ